GHAAADLAIDGPRQQGPLRARLHLRIAGGRQLLVDDRDQREGPVARNRAEELARAGADEPLAQDGVDVVEVPADIERAQPGLLRRRREIAAVLAPAQRDPA